VPLLRWLLELRRTGDPHALILAFGLLTAATIVLTVFAPGDPSYDRRGWGPALLVFALLVLFLERGSRIAWWVALFMTAPCVFIYAWVAFFGSGGSFGPKALAAALLQAAAVWVLTAPALEASLGKRSPRVAPSP
jgi:hypothetical protein